jgi:hypothetical protein
VFSIAAMKAWILLPGLLSLFAAAVRAEDSRLEQSTRVTEDAAYYNKLVPLDAPRVDSDVITKKKFRISGPLVRPFKAKKITEVPRRLLHLINPFARTDSPSGSSMQTVRDLSPRAWTTAVGWHSGGSSFQNEITHEPQMNLLSVGSSQER